MLRRCALAAGALVAAFHVWLFAAQVWSGHVAQPDVLLRWLVAGALVAGLIALGRRGLPVVFGRHAIAVWLLAALLHGPALANDLDGFATPSMPEAATLAPSILGAALVLMVAAAIGAPSVSFSRVVRSAASGRVARLHAGGFELASLPRPPPLR